MAVANDTILQKMTNELQQAQRNQDKQAVMLKHIENIRLLCDLFLMEDHAEPVLEKGELSAVERKAMLGEVESPSAEQAQSFKKSIELDDEDGNGNSIFDF
ncbi:YwdI family protein [Ornithinibacillus contaminans]|uniref:YwdI family protein n=1 Tax=Ornithinibacillus contaminans TaxID=694055 RepID=UPI00064DC437|nr:YwdI family protein [Ornithinibacillus contaminans]